jgi:hypothetical protein
MMLRNLVANKARAFPQLEARIIALVAEQLMRVFDRGVIVATLELGDILDRVRRG